MDIAAYEIEADIEGTHWWFAGRRRLFAAEIERTGLHQDAAILDIGTSTGTNLRMLRTLGFSVPDGFTNNAERFDFAQTTIRYLPGSEAHAQLLASYLVAPPAFEKVDFLLNADVSVVVGADWQGVRSSPTPTMPLPTSTTAPPSGRGRTTTTTTTTTVPGAPTLNAPRAAWS